MLEAYVARKDRSPEELTNYYKDIIRTLYNTPAWGVSGVNKMVNELTESVRATLTHAKKGKTSAYAHAAKMLRYVDFYGNETATARYCGRHKLMPLITEEEFQQLLTVA
jgi:hypothetical protein